MCTFYKCLAVKGKDKILVEERSRGTSKTCWDKKNTSAKTVDKIYS